MSKKSARDGANAGGRSDTVLVDWMRDFSLTTQEDYVEFAKASGLMRCEAPLLQVGFTPEQLKQCHGREIVAHWCGDIWSQFVCLLDYGVQLRGDGFTVKQLLSCDAKKIKALSSLHFYDELRSYVRAHLDYFNANDIEAIQQWHLALPQISIESVNPAQLMMMAKHLSAVLSIQNTYAAVLCLNSTYGNGDLAFAMFCEQLECLKRQKMQADEVEMQAQFNELYGMHDAFEEPLVTVAGGALPEGGF